MSLNMLGHIDGVFQSTTVTLTVSTPGYYDGGGDYVAGVDTVTTHVATVQPATMKQIEFLQVGGERVTDARQVWVNDGAELPLGAKLTFLGSDWKILQADNRPWRNRAKAIVERLQ